MNAKVDTTCVDSPAIMMLTPVCPCSSVFARDARAPPAACRTSEMRSQAMKKHAMNLGVNQDIPVP